ncbi:ZYRO0G22418p [Zygosaccharomyces rouxii]|uniref:ZYRO0G22418p n=1 Tax=Zygosaccharomyces rouxii (strain ATCC 2623 / CBS 732 / NBRC 1130 / NCYC 568 / NRRL Y-229) TaxID=559307 RepID=C5E1N3_ZYGRC|nr:uncharacterized protein ZYRO0G22418g [Zygosaccharomyces rouxii]KAH9203009.1 DNA photolyase, FAD-binding/Cryptochrome [Zygosaccharomyces rouxii]CAR30017.1 ZYRO0G22418p [Zygosaccharomyces rouxii]
MKRQSTHDLEQLQSKRGSYDWDQYLRPNPLYYPHAIDAKGALEFNNGKRKRPYDELQGLLSKQNRPGENVKTVIHWFRNDLRIHDNTGFYTAVEESQRLGARILTIFTINQNDWIAHLDSNPKLTLMYQSLKSLHGKLSELGIPLYTLVFDSGEPKLSNSMQFVIWLRDQCLKISNGAIYLTANAEYLADELYRDIRVFAVSDEKFQFNVFHDTCIVEPGVLKTNQDSPYTVFSPWYKKWCLRVMDGKSSTNLIEPLVLEKRIYNDDEEFVHKEFSYYLPSQFLSSTTIPDASEDAAWSRLTTFLQKNVGNYLDKDTLLTEASSHLSPYLALGILSARCVVNEAFRLVGSRLVGKSPKDMTPVEQFIREVAWRDFYKDVICFWPYLSMDIPFNLSSLEIKWDNNFSNFQKWCLGKTGFPIVDAIMRKLSQDGYINNRARMITASFLSKNLLIDWRWGEKWFRKHLIDCDLASNVGGWGFVSSTGADAQPYFRVFNMERQSRAFDPNGEFIKKWVPELKNSKNVHSSIQEVESYPNPITDSKSSRQRALEIYNEGLYG